MHFYSILFYRYPLRYHNIATRQRLIMLVFFVWCFTACVSILSKIPFLFDQTSVHLLTIIDVILHRVFDIVALILLIVASLYVLRVRRRHMEEIRKRRRYFGLHGEELHVLKSMAVSIREIFKLNIFTALLVITEAVCRLLNLFCVPGVYKYWFRIPGFIFFMSNPFVYMCVMKELRNHYLRLLKCKRQRQIEPELMTKNALCNCGKQVVVSGGGRASNVVRSEGGSGQIGLRCTCNRDLAPSVIYNQGTITSN